MKAPGSQDQLVVHECSLGDGADLGEEDFLNQGEGSHFVSRVSELVLVKPSAEGLTRLPDKVEQLVGKGFHNIIVDLDGLGELEADALKILVRVKSYLENWAGSLRLCRPSDSVRHKLNVLGIDEGLAVLDALDDAVADYRDALSAPPAESVSESTEEDESEAKASEPAGAEDLNDWGWGAEESETSGPAPVDVAELLVEDTELSRLASDVRRIVARGRKYVTLRLYFTRPMSSEDVDVLSTCRDYLRASGGQLALVSLQHEVLKWLRMLEFDREFHIMETADDADQLHRRHAAGETIEEPARAVAAQVAPAPSPAQEASTKTTSESDAALSDSDAALSESGESLSESSFEFESGDDLALPEDDAELEIPSDPEPPVATPEAAAPETAAPAPEAEPGSLSESAMTDELDALLTELAAAQVASEQAQEQLAKAQKQLAASESSRKELQASVRRDERRIVELEQGKSRAETQVEESQAAHAAAQAEAGRLEGEVTRLRQELDAAKQAKTRVAELEMLLDQQDGVEAELGSVREEAARHEGRAGELEATLAERDAALAERDATLAERDATLAERDATLAERDARIGELEAGQSKLSELEGTLAARDTRIGELERECQRLQSSAAQGERELQEARAALAAVPPEGAGSERVDPAAVDDIGVLRQRCTFLEEEKARILTEAEAEIERLTREQALLSEELESAGEMIERLGKELELS